MTNRRANRKKLPFLELAMLLAGLLFVSPCFLALLNAFKTNREITMNPLALPQNLNLDNFTLELRTGLEVQRGGLCDECGQQIGPGESGKAVLFHTLAASVLRGAGLTSRKLTAGSAAGAGFQFFVWGSERSFSISEGWEGLRFPA